MAMGNGDMPPPAPDPEDLEEYDDAEGQGEEAGAEPDEEWQHIHRQLQQALQEGGADGMIDLSNLAAMMAEAGEAGSEGEWQDVSGGALLAVFQCCEEGREQDLASMLSSSTDDSTSGLDINAPGPDGDTALHLACLYGHAGCVDLLLAHGADPGAINDQDGSSVLHDAAAGGYLGICKLMLGKVPALVKVADEDGDTPLHNAARGNHADVVQLLLAAGADPSATNGEGNTPAQEAEEEDVVELLQKAVVAVA